MLALSRKARCPAGTSGASDTDKDATAAVRGNDESESGARRSADSPMQALERRPTGKRWSKEDVSSSELTDAAAVALACSIWHRTGGLMVISSLELAELPDGSGEVGPQWHISISHSGERPRVVSGVLRAFKMALAEEDNHHPGIARHFWLPVNPAHRVDCECKETEVTVVESDGYRWQNTGTGPCRGCDFERVIGRPCPVHGVRSWRAG